MLERVERVERGRRYVQSYDDFRLFDGEYLPGRIRSVDSLGNERTEALLSRAYDIAVPSHPFDIPPDRRTIVEFPGTNGPVRLPARLVNGLFVIRVAINGHDADFLLDSGSGAVAIDPSLAETLALEHYGPHINATVGTYPESSAIVPQLAIGALRMTHVAVRVIPIPFRADARTKISGLLGFDFFAGATLRVDYDRGTVDAYAPGAYSAPHGWSALTLTLDDKITAVNLPDPDVEVSPQTFALEDADGLLGADLLHNVALWFDYRANAIHIKFAARGQR